MSSRDLQKNIGAFIVKELSRINKTTKSDSKTSSRKELEKVEGQVFVVKWADVRKELNRINEKFGLEHFTKSEFSTIRSNLDKIFSKLGKPNANRTKSLLEFVDWLKVRKPIKGAANYYIVANYGTVQRSKGPGGAANHLIAKAVQKKANNSIQDQGYLASSISGNQLKGSDKSDLSGFQVGHGEFGGVASSGISVAKLKNLGFKKFAEGTKERDFFKAVIHKYEVAMDLDLEHRQIINVDGTLKKNYKVILSFQGATSNQEDGSRVEKAAVKALKDRASKYVLLKSSTSLPDVVEEIVLANLTKGKRVKTKGKKPRKRIKEDSKTKSKTKVKRTVTRKVIKGKGVAGKVKKPKRGKKPSKRDENLKSLIGLQVLINAKLPEQIKGNMGTPALNNITGRFAESAKVVNILPGATNRHNPIIDYTYLKRPYEVFETTPPWATPQRDPKKIIDQSIREIAVALTTARFITRRV